MCSLMSSKHRYLVWENSKASGLDKLVLVYLADAASHDGYCWPTVATISKCCGVSESTVHRAIKTLVELGELEVVKRAGEIDGKTISNMFRVLLGVSVGNPPGASQTPSLILETNHTYESPPTPQGGNGAVVAKATKKRLTADVLDKIPAELFLRSSESFAPAWRRWVNHKLGRLGNKVTIQAMELDMKKLAGYPSADEAIEAIDFAIQACWMAVGKYRPRLKSPAEEKRSSPWGCIA